MNCNLDVDVEIPVIKNSHTIDAFTEEIGSHFVRILTLRLVMCNDDCSNQVLVFKKFNAQYSNILKTNFKQVSFCR